MFKTFTNDDSLRFLYGEMELFEQICFEAALTNDKDLYKEFVKLKETVELLDTLPVFSPANFSLKLIKSFNFSFENLRLKHGNFHNYLN